MLKSLPYPKTTLFGALPVVIGFGLIIYAFGDLFDFGFVLRAGILGLFALMVALIFLFRYFVEKEEMRNAICFALTAVGAAAMGFVGTFEKLRTDPTDQFAELIFMAIVFMAIGAVIMYRGTCTEHDVPVGT